jgi:hypothetical protein
MSSVSNHEFTLATALDLNMGYCHIKLDADSHAHSHAQKLCTIIVLRGQCNYRHLAMVIQNGPAASFKNSCPNFPKTSWNMEYFDTYLDDLLKMFQ